MQCKGGITWLPLGRVVATRGILEMVSQNELLTALRRHQTCDWGEVSRSDWAANDWALTHGGRVLSAYLSVEQIRFWIITEADRSVTTLLLPEEY